jgi:hypothetical protein
MAGVASWPRTHLGGHYRLLYVVLVADRASSLGNGEFVSNLFAHFYLRLFYQSFFHLLSQSMPAKTFYRYSRNPADPGMINMVAYEKDCRRNNSYMIFLAVVT